MGTYISISLPKEKKHLFKKAFDLFKKIDNRFSKYKPTSYVYKLNKRKFAKLDDEFLYLLRISLKIYEETNGYFDITLGNITKKYGDFYLYKEKINLKNNSSGIKNIQISERYIYLKNNISLDFGGIGKGYAVDLVADFLISNGVKEGVIKASGDIRCINTCLIGIKNPFGKGIIFSFFTKHKNTSISTSGNYERFIKTKKDNHLINPKTKKSQQQIASVTLISISNNTYLDAYTTAVSVMPLREALNFLKRKKIAYVIYTTDGKEIISNNICNFIICN